MICGYAKCAWRWIQHTLILLLQHTVAVTAADEVVTWGANQEGQSGQGEVYSRDAIVKPRFLSRLSGQMVTQVVCGELHTLCVTATAQVPAHPLMQRVAHVGQADVVAYLASISWSIIKARYSVSTSRLL